MITTILLMFLGLLIISNLLNILIALDQLITALLGGFPDETLSSYAYRLRLQEKPWGFTANIIDWLFRPFGTDHCRNSYEAERNRVQLPPELR